MATSLSAQLFLDFVKNRRSCYELSSTLPLPKDRIEEIVRDLVLHCPTPYNSQATRVVILFGNEHTKLWNVVSDVMKPILAPKIGIEASTVRFEKFKNSAATIMFFEDTNKIKSLQERFAFVADKWPLWATQADAMLQFSIWAALEAEGLGCNLQHYHPEIDEKVAEAFDIPDGWKLNAQLVMGGNPDVKGLPEKTFEPLEDRVRVRGA